MKKKLLSLLSIVAFAISSNAQVIDDNFCLTDELEAEILLDPLAVDMYAHDELIRQQEAATPTPKAITWYIPIVFHVVHQGGLENISEEQILDALEILNRDWDLQNPDAANVHNDFNASNPNAYVIPADVDIQFVLATKAPDGTCFSGITRTLSSAAGSNTALTNAVINGNDVYQGEWPGNMYMNVIIANDIGVPGSAAYTYRPSTWLGYGMEFGIFVRHIFVGSIGTAASSGRTLTHEAGHWLNLKHVWGDGNQEAVGDPAGCQDDDGVDDTPRCWGAFSCNVNQNSCNQDNAYWGGIDVRDNIENYMDYSGCDRMFTQGQVNRMRNSLNSSICQRNNLKTPGNLIATGADGNIFLCAAEFSADRTSICAGEQIQFTDESYNVVSGWTWTFTGGTPLNSTAENPSVTYDTPGLYTVTLIATDGANDDTEIKTSFIRVLPAASSIPLVEGFETYSTLNNIEEWEVKNDGGNGFEIVNVGLNSAKSVKLANNGQPTGYYDELISAPVDLSGVTGSMTLSYRYAYKRRNSSDDDWFRVYVTGDCGENWSIRKTVHGFQLSSATQTSAYTPTSESDWMTVHMTNITSQFWVEKFRYRFVFESGGGNNFYLDNINLYEGSPSDDIVAGLNEGEEINGLAVYPNPVDDELSVRFIMNSAMSATMFIQDVSGKIVQNHLVQANQGTNVVYMDTQELSSGMYFLRVNVGGAQQTIQFVVK